jgi:ribonuclease Z
MIKNLPMTKLTFLGTASAVPDKDHHNTHFLLVSPDRVILVDCSGNPVVRLNQIGIDPLNLTDVVLTHFHPDHVSGLPLLLMDLWLLGREKRLDIFGLQDVIDRTKKMMDLYEWQTWQGFYPVIFHSLNSEENTTLINTDQTKLWAFPVCHMIPGIGLKIALTDSSICYSSDTAPCDAVLKMATSVDLLIHEATGEGLGHTSAEQAGKIAQQAGVKKLCLIHYDPSMESEKLIAQAKTTFSGEVFIANDLMTISFY